MSHGSMLIGWICSSSRLQPDHRVMTVFLTIFMWIRIRYPIMRAMWLSLSEPRVIRISHGKRISTSIREWILSFSMDAFPSHLQCPWLLRATMRSPLRSPAQVEGTQGFLPQPGKDLERPSSTRLEARVTYHGSGAMTRSPSPLAWRPDFPGAPREAH